MDSEIRFFRSKAFRNQQIIRSFLKDPKTSVEIRRFLKMKHGLQKSTAFNALKELIRRGEVIGEINAESLKNTKDLVPVYRDTGKLVAFWIEEREEHRPDARVTREVVFDRKSNIPIYTRRIEKIARKLEGGPTYRRSSWLPVNLEEYKKSGKIEPKAGAYEWVQKRKKLEIQDQERNK